MKKFLAVLAVGLFVAASIALAQTPSVPMGTINGVTAGAGLGGGGTLGNVSLSSSIAVNRQLGTSYTVLTSDQAKLVTFSNLSSVAISLPTAGSAGFAAGWWTLLSNYGPGNLTITPASGTIAGFASLTIQSNVGVQVVSDGANWQITGNQSTAGFVTLGANNVWTGTNNFTGGLSINGTALTLPVSVANGGTGNVSLSSNGVLIGQGTGAVATVAPGVAGTVLTSNGLLSAPTYQSGTSSVTSVAAGTGLTATPSPITTTGTLALANIATSTVLGNVSGSTAAPIALSTAQLTTLINIFNSTSSGAVPPSGGGTTNFLRADGTFAAPTGGFSSVAIQVRSTTGTYTPTASMKYVIVFLNGPGGGGAGGATSFSGSGGGAGQTSVGFFTAASIGSSKAVVIGTGGNGGAATNNGSNGSASSTFGSTLLISAAGAGGVANGAGGAGGTGGSGGTANIVGGAGQGGASTTVDTAQGGQGGSPIFFGAPGNGGNGTGGTGGTGGVGINGGGGGGGGDGAGAGGVGGNGGAGYALFIEFI